MTPVTVIIVMFAFDWRLALAAAITAPLAWLVYRWSTGLVARTDHRHDDAKVDASNRVVEFSQAQAVLRGFGYATRSFKQLDDALQEQRDAGPRPVADRRARTRRIRARGAESRSPC